MSTPTLQALALAAREDEAKGRLLRFLAKLGGSGQRPGNMHRDIVACLRKRARRLHIIPRPLRVVLKLGWEWRLMDTSIIYPHELFASLCEHRPKAWQEIMLGGGEQELSKFWEDVGPYPHMVGRPDYRTKMHPLMVMAHGDGVALVQAGRAGGRGVDVLSLGVNHGQEASDQSYHIPCVLGLQPPDQEDRLGTDLEQGLEAHCLVSSGHLQRPVARQES